MRAKLTVFRAQANVDDYLDVCSIDYGGVTQNGIVYAQFILAGEDRGGTNGSAAVVQSATGTASGDADVSATLAAFGATENITLALIGMTDDGAGVDITLNTSEFDDLYAVYATGATYFAGLAWAIKFGNNTTPLADIQVADASGMVALELKANQTNVEPLIGTYGQMGIVAAPGTNGVNYDIFPYKLERAFTYSP